MAGVRDHTITFVICNGFLDITYDVDQLDLAIAFLAPGDNERILFTFRSTSEVWLGLNVFVPVIGYHTIPR